MPADPDVTAARIPVPEEIIARGQVWPRIAQMYGVANPAPPWKSSLDGTCEALDKEGAALPLLTRRNDEDHLASESYETLPLPEIQLVALAHSLIARGVIDEDALASRMEEVRARLEVGSV